MSRPVNEKWVPVRLMLCIACYKRHPRRLMRTDYICTSCYRQLVAENAGDDR